MQPNQATRIYRKMIVFSLYAAPVFLFLGDLLWMPGKHIAEGTLLRWVSYLLFFPATLGITHLLMQGRAWRLGLAGGILSWVGLCGGLSILTLYRLGAVLAPAASGVPQVVEKALFTNALLPASIFLPGLLFPVSLMLLGIAFFRAGQQSLLSLLLFACGPLFWMGNALDITPVLLLADAALLLVFAWTARRYPFVQNQQQDGIGSHVAPVLNYLERQL